MKRLFFIPFHADHGASNTGTQLPGYVARMQDDRALFLANMTTASEKQYYAFALLQELFDHLPINVTVGLLYDISCTIHRSCVKYGFLCELLPCLSFAISIFHAYGHQWACQIVYHPRKCTGFGLSNGEGCERFWSWLKKLIPSLRVSGVRPYLN